MEAVERRVDRREPAEPALHRTEQHHEGDDGREREQSGRDASAGAPEGMREDGEQRKRERSPPDEGGVGGVARAARRGTRTTETRIVSPPAYSRNDARRPRRAHNVHATIVTTGPDVAVLSPPAARPGRAAR